MIGINRGLLKQSLHCCCTAAVGSILRGWAECLSEGIRYRWLMGQRFLHLLQHGIQGIDVCLHLLHLQRHLTLKQPVQFLRKLQSVTHLKVLCHHCFSDSQQLTLQK